MKNGSENTQSASSSDAYLNTIVRLTSIVRGNISRDFKFIFSDAGMLESKPSSWCNEWNSIGLESVNNTISRYDSVLSKLLQPTSPLIDYIGLNYYPDLVSTANNIVTIADNLTAKYNKPIIITETGMNTTDENTKKTIMKAEFAALTLVPNIPMVFVHYDIGGVYGVKNNDRTPRPAYSEIPRSVDIRVSTKPSWCNVTYTDISTRLPVCDILENL